MENQSQRAKRQGLTYKNDFEMIYLRHDYFVRAKSPPPEIFERYQHTLKQMSVSLALEHDYSLRAHGFGQGDVMTMLMVFLVPYVGLYSYIYNEEYRRRAKELYDAEVESGKKPVLDYEDWVWQKELVTLKYFFRQRMRQSVEIMRRKEKISADGRAVEVYQRICGNGRFMLSETESGSKRKTWKRVAASNKAVKAFIKTAPLNREFEHEGNTFFLHTRSKVSFEETETDLFFNEASMSRSGWDRAAGLCYQQNPEIAFLQRESGTSEKTGHSFESILDDLESESVDDKLRAADAMIACATTRELRDEAKKLKTRIKSKYGVSARHHK
jgi:hypothetical protein